MKMLTIAISSTLLVLGSAHAATSSKLVDEMEDYVRDLIRAHPEVIGDKKKTQAREAMVNNAGQQRVFELTEDEAKLLRRRKDLVKDSDYRATLEKMKALHSKDPEITFLIKYAEQEKIKSAEKLLAYRLMKLDYAQAAEKVAAHRSKIMHTILKKYADYKAANSKPPQSLHDLELPQECKKFTNSKGKKVDWIYIGHLGPQLKTDNSHIVLIEPEPNGDVRICGMDNGQVTRFQNNSVEGHINKLVETMKKDDTNRSAQQVATNTSSASLMKVMKKIALHKDLYNNKLPNSLNDLKIDEADKCYTDPETGEKTPWIYLGKSSKIQGSSGVKIIIAAPKAHQTKRLAGLSNGKIVLLNDDSIAPLLK